MGYHKEKEILEMNQVEREWGNAIMATKYTPSRLERKSRGKRKKKRFAHHLGKKEL